jgi:hypothetical protein
VTAECDPLLDEGETYADGLRRASLDVELRRYPSMIHGFFQMTAALDAAQRLHDALAQWLTARSAPPASNSERLRIHKDTVANHQMSELGALHAGVPTRNAPRQAGAPAVAATRAASTRLRSRPVAWCGTRSDGIDGVPDRTEAL